MNNGLRASLITLFFLVLNISEGLRVSYVPKTSDSLSWHSKVPNLLNHLSIPATFFIATHKNLIFFVFRSSRMCTQRFFHSHPPQVEKNWTNSHSSRFLPLVPHTLWYFSNTAPPSRKGTQGCMEKKSEGKKIEDFLCLKERKVC